MKSIWNFAFIFGLGALAIGLFLLIQQYILHRRCTVETQGLSGIAYQFKLPYRTLTYKAGDEELSMPLSGSNDLVEGQTVTVVYDPDNTKRHYIIEDTSTVRILGIAFTIGGIIFMLCGYGVSTGLFQEVWTGHFRIN